MSTNAIEDYLKTIYELQQKNEKVTTSALADALSIAPASATAMVKKLAEKKLVTHEPYYGVSLSKAGKKIALEVVRHHRLIELYLAQALGVPWDQVHEEAEKWEHILSEDIEERMDQALGFPTHDPHGAPIPSRDGTMNQPACIPLHQVASGQTAQVAEVDDRDPELLRHFDQLGLYPKTVVRVISNEPFQGLIRIQIQGQEHVLGHEAAKHILMTNVEHTQAGK